MNVNDKEQAEFHVQYDFFTRNRTNQKLLGWVIKYLSKKGIFVSQQTIGQVKNTLFIAFQRNNEKDTFDFFRKMDNAWDAHNRRQASNNSMLNVSISKKHKSMFLQMAKDAECTNIQMLERLIGDNYKNFLHSKDKERIVKDAEKATKEDIKKNKSFTNEKLNGEILRLNNYVSGYKSQISKLKNELGKIKDNSDQLFDIVMEVATNEQGFSQKNLLEVSRLHTLIEMHQLPNKDPT
ncbi:hypothetical protein ACRWQN_02770 [Shewanella sp. HL-SH8]|uniref:hypothetical protein n=1 Tax=Shewanella sp. HL-SH8 TaxID=3436242 RepID=UPI003EC01850